MRLIMNTYLRAVFRFLLQKYKILPYFVLFFTPVRDKK